MVRKKVDLLIENAAELITIKGATQRPCCRPQPRDLGIIRHGSIAINDGLIVQTGRAEELKSRFRSEEVIDATGKVVMPGFVDPHTHLVFSGSREDEFHMRVEGAAYMEILAKGGGILKTVDATRKASKEMLLGRCAKALDVMLHHGTTTVESKSGYGLSTESEVKCLEVMKQLDRSHPVDVVPTFMGAHATPLDYRDNEDEYVDLIVNEMIPKVAENGLADFCDVFCEEGVFSIAQSRRILRCGLEHGLSAKIHADEMTWLGGAELAAELQATSADHLLFTSDKGFKAMAQQRILGILLPLASFSLMTNHYANARMAIAVGVPVALGTDYNPSCWAEDQQTTIAFAYRMLRMTPSEAILATTINAAHAIDRAQSIGSLERGKKADILILGIPSHKLLGYRFGVNLVAKVIKDGQVVVDEREGNHK
ncbi:MAG: imidazolonepropionase [Candidatus Bathyarchaeota archaeon]|nr:MAG: imidazolonepropionase [Candidatus Bathyarchaeota archaeon]